MLSPFCNLTKWKKHAQKASTHKKPFESLQKGLQGLSEYEPDFKEHVTNRRIIESKRKQQ